MTHRISKSRFQARPLEYLRHIQASGKPIIVTDHGRPRFEIRPVCSVDAAPAHDIPDRMRGAATLAWPLADDDWEAAQ